MINQKPALNVAQQMFEKTVTTSITINYSSAKIAGTLLN